MAESVDALVSNTSGATRAGSTPALGTNKREVYASLLSYPEPYFNLTPSKNKRPTKKHFLAGLFFCSYDLFLIFTLWILTV